MPIKMNKETSIKTIKDNIEEGSYLLIDRESKGKLKERFVTMGIVENLDNYDFIFTNQRLFHEYEVTTAHPSYGTFMSDSKFNLKEDENDIKGIEILSEEEYLEIKEEMDRLMDINYEVPF